MNITIKNMDLFAVPQGYYLAHCISADFALGAGIAKKFDEVYNMRFKLFREYDNYEYEGGDSLPIDNVFNLVTKKKCFHKPTYDSLREALECMKYEMEILGVTKLAMPRIASGLDRLEWSRVYEIVCEVFEGMDVEILICEL